MLTVPVWAAEAWPIAEEHPDHRRRTVERRLNVVLISLDTVRPDHLSCYGYGRETTPEIDWIAQAGVLFTQAFAQAPNTLPSHLSLLTSRHPTRQWVFWEGADLEPSDATLVEILKRHGYATAAFVGLETHQRLLASRPFQAFNDLVPAQWLRTPPDELFTWLATHRHEPFFLFVHGFDAHEPHLLSIRYHAKRFDPAYQGRLASTLFDRVPTLTTDDLKQLPHRA